MSLQSLPSTERIVFTGISESLTPEGIQFFCERIQDFIQQGREKVSLVLQGKALISSNGWIIPRARFPSPFDFNMKLTQGLFDLDMRYCEMDRKGLMAMFCRTPKLQVKESHLGFFARDKVSELAITHPGPFPEPLGNILVNNGYIPCQDNNLEHRNLKDRVQSITSFALGITSGDERLFYQDKYCGDLIVFCGGEIFFHSPNDNNTNELPGGFRALSDNPEIYKEAKNRGYI